MTRIPPRNSETLAAGYLAEVPARGDEARPRPVSRAPRLGAGRAHAQLCHALYERLAQAYGAMLRSKEATTFLVSLLQRQLGDAELLLQLFDQSKEAKWAPHFHFMVQGALLLHAMQEHLDRWRAPGASDGLAPAADAQSDPFLPLTLQYQSLERSYRALAEQAPRQ